MPMPRLSYAPLLAVTLALLSSPCLSSPRLSAPSLGAPSLSAKPRSLLVGFYLPWDGASKSSLLEHASALDVIAPMSGALDSASGTLRWQDDPGRAEALAHASVKPKVFPLVSNAHDNVWDTAAADGALLDPNAEKAFIDGLLSAADRQGFGGYILDLENLSPGAVLGYPAFLAKLRSALKGSGRSLWVTAGLSADPGLVQKLAATTDAVVLMAYDQCWASATPGPVAGQDWFEQSLNAKLAGLPASHVVVALGAYGYDWPQGKTAAVISAPDAARLATSTGRTIVRQPPAANPHFAYAGPDGRPHSVWYLDGTTFRAERAVAQARKTRGVAIWRLGLEDPAIWSKSAKPPLAGPSQIAPPACTALPPSP